MLCVQLLLLAACGRGHEGDKLALQGAPAGSATTAHAGDKAGFMLMSGSSSVRNDRTQLELVFNAKLAAAQPFDDVLAVTGPSGETVSGSWGLSDDGTTLSFPYVTANTRYAVAVKRGLLAADGRTLGHAVKRDI
jgi:hypothetical protein